MGVGESVIINPGKVVRVTSMKIQKHSDFQEMLKEKAQNYQ
jgi:hypothetical protein